MVAIIKQLKVFLVGAAVLIPALSPMVAEGVPNKNQACADAGHDEQAERKLAVLLQDETVFFHDYVFALLDFQREFLDPMFPPQASIDFRLSNQKLLNQNADKIAQVVFPDDKKKRKELVKALKKYIQAGENYAAALTDIAIGGDPENSLVKKVFKQQWIPAAKKLAKVLALNCENVQVKKEIRRVVLKYTRLLKEMVDLLSFKFIATLPPLISFEALTSPNFSEASRVYERARIVAAEELAPLVTTKCL
jgi:hypothetical protein